MKHERNRCLGFAFFVEKSNFCSSRCTTRRRIVRERMLYVYVLYVLYAYLALFLPTFLCELLRLPLDCVKVTLRLHTARLVPNKFDHFHLFVQSNLRSSSASLSFAASRALADTSSCSTAVISPSPPRLNAIAGPREWKKRNFTIADSNAFSRLSIFEVKSSIKSRRNFGHTSEWGVQIFMRRAKNCYGGTICQ